MTFFNRSKIKKILSESLLKNLIKNSGILLGGNVGTSVLGLLSLIVTTRSLGAQEFGVLVIVSTYVTIIDKLVNFQSWQALIKYGSHYLSEEKNRSFESLVKTSALLDIFSAIFGVLIAYLLAPIIGEVLNWEKKLVYFSQIYSCIIIFNLTGMPTGVLRIFDRFSLFAIQGVIASTIKLIGVIIAWYLSLELVYFIYIWLFSEIIRYSILLILGYRVLSDEGYDSWWTAKIIDFKKTVRFTFWTNITSTFDLPVKQFDIMLVSSIISTEATGIYKVIKQVGLILTQIADPIYQAIFPDFTRQIAEYKIKKAFKYAFKSGLLLFMVTFPVALLLSISSGWWFPFTFGPSFINGLSELQVYLILISLSVAFITIHPLFVAIGYVKQNAMIILFCNTFYLIIAFYLGSQIGLMGIVISFGIQFLCVVTIKILFLKKYLNESIDHKST